MTTDTLEKNSAYWQEVLDKAFDGDSKALGELCQDYLRPKVYAYIRSVLKSRYSQEDIEDIVQDVFVRLVKAYLSITERSVKSFESCVIKIAKNACINSFRGEKRWMSYMINEQSLTCLASENLPEELVNKLEAIKHRKVTGLTNFVALLRRTIGSDQTSQFKSQVLKCAEEEDTTEDFKQTVAKRKDVFTDPRGYLRLKTFFDKVQEVLSKEQWQVIYLHDIEGFTYREIRQQTDLSLRKINNLRQKAFKKMAHRHLLWKNALFSDMVR